MDRLKKIKEILLVLIPIFSLLISACSLYLSYQTSKRQDEVQENLVMPSIGPSFRLAEDESKYVGADIVSDGHTSGMVEVSVYPYLIVSCYRPSGPFYEGRGVAVIEDDGPDILAVDQFLVPILPCSEFYKVTQRDAKEKVIASIQDSDFSESLTEYLAGATGYFEANYGIDSLSIRLEYFLEISYRSRLGIDYCDVYRVTTGIYEGIHANPEFSLVESGPSRNREFASSVYMNFRISLVAPDYRQIFHMLKREIDSYEHCESSWVEYANPEYQSTDESHEEYVLRITLPADREVVYQSLLAIILKYQTN